MAFATGRWTVTRKALWITGFLAITGLAVTGELVAAFDHSDATAPWTELLTDLPWWITMPAALLLAVWLPLHLAHWYRLRRATPTGGITVTALATLTAAADARNRAFRTFVQGLGVDVAAAVALAVGPAVAGDSFAWTRTYWVTVALLALKTAVQSGVSYLARKAAVPAPYVP